MKKLKQNQKGFTLIELLVVIAIIGLLASVVLLALNSARQKSRDAKRVADVRQVQSALELYYNDNNEYPAEAGTTGLPDMTDGDPAFSTFLAQYPNYPLPAADGDDCGAQPARYDYVSTNTDYEIHFCLAGPTGGLSQAGAYTATSSGITKD